jgi:hypothetical protein
MRLLAQAMPAQAPLPEPLSAEDLAIVKSLELLEALDLLESLGPDGAPPLPEDEEREAK